nr:MAG TPA: Baseplate wedge protein [Caudoviricetes sp.]
MLPVTGDILQKNLKIVYKPSKTFRLDTDQKRIVDMTDGLEAIRQSVYCILNTERFEWLIYSWNYGTELNDLFGKSAGFVKAKVKKRIREALKQDDRITEVNSFSFEMSKRSLHVTFTVYSLWGEIEAEKEVKI